MIVVKVIELIGSLPNNKEEANQECLGKSSLTIMNNKSIYQRTAKQKFKQQDS
jgi:flavin-binding protein dodecin